MNMQKNIKREYWQAIRGICILAVVIIHSLGGFDYSAGHNTEFVILRQIVNFAVATFVFMAGYFVDVNKITDEKFNYKNWLIYRGGRLCIPFIIWSIIYSGLTLLKSIYNGSEIHWLGFAYRFAVGKSATPFYYIVVLMQLTIITPWLVKVIKEDKKIKSILWIITPVYFVYLYMWNFIKGSSPRLYETLFPAWFGFYYLGIQVRCGLKFKYNGYIVIVAWLMSCVEALILRKFGGSIGFCTSQITMGSFLYSGAMLGWILKRAEEGVNSNKLLAKVGDCSYGIFYIHMAILMVVGKFINCDNWYSYWILRFVVTSVISFGIVYISQILLKKYNKLLKYFGFV